MKKRIFSIFMSVLMVMSLMSTVAFAAEVETADPSSTARASSSSFTGFLMNKATITPVVVREGSSYQMALKNYAKTTTFSGSHHNIARWNSYSISGFNQYIIDNNYKMVGWNISVSGKYAVANEGSVIPADRLWTFEYTAGDDPTVKENIQYFENLPVTISWFAALPDELTDYNSVDTELNCVTTYIPGIGSGFKTQNDSLDVSLTYWPKYGVDA